MKRLWWTVGSVIFCLLSDFCDLKPVIKGYNIIYGRGCKLCTNNKSVCVYVCVNVCVILSVCVRYCLCTRARVYVCLCVGIKIRNVYKFWHHKCNSKKIDWMLWKGSTIIEFYLSTSFWFSVDKEFGSGGHIKSKFNKENMQSIRC